MRSISTFVYFSIPALVYTTIDIVSGSLRSTFSAEYFLLNYLFFRSAFRCLARGGACLSSFALGIHGGFIAATTALLILHLQFECCVDNANGLGWLYYWPVAALLMVIPIGVELTVRRIAKDA